MAIDATPNRRRLRQRSHLEMAVMIDWSTLRPRLKIFYQLASADIDSPPIMRLPELPA
jgi:hypothetical protein